MGYQKVKGTLDYYGINSIKLRYLENVSKEVVSLFGFNEIITPIIENTECFYRIGDESDIVSKEMYTFKDKGDRSITLRPEGTAAVVRSILENKLYQNNVLKVFYNGPMFRYERPQIGRYRQFDQFGVELFGADSPYADCDVILSAFSIFKKLDIGNIKLKINSIGDFASRNDYSKALIEYFAPLIDNMCDDCKRRLQKNPMRILDCKVDKENPILLNAPKIKDYLTEEAKIYFKKVLELLEKSDIKYELDDNLVRGLDYYTDTVFEFIIDSDDELNGLAVCAGGKYSQLVKNMGGPDIPGIGYAFGLERLLAIKDKQNSWNNLDKSCDVVIMGLDEESKKESMLLAQKLRENEMYVEYDYKNISMKQQFKLSERVNAKFIVIIGENELKNKKYTIKDTLNKTQEEIGVEDIINYLKEKLK